MPTQMDGVNAASPATGGGINQSISKKAMGKDDFLKLLVTQLQNQDPLKPTDNTEFVAQLAQFSSLEGITNLEKSMEGMSSSISAMQNYSSASLIGKNIKADGNGFGLAGGAATFGYSLGGGAESTSVSVSDKSGRVVKRFDYGPAQKGEYTVTWDGKDSLGNPAPAGAYTFAVSAKDASGAPVDSAAFITGPVSSVSFDAAGAKLVVNGSAVPRDAVRQIY